VYKLPLSIKVFIVIEKWLTSDEKKILVPKATNLPTLTVAIPTFNEEKTIERIIRGFLETSYDNLIEIYIADGHSTDSTVEIVRRIGLEDSRVKLLHNPMRIQSTGLNLILDQAAGEIFLRADAHSDYAPDYIEQCVRALLNSEALNAGGAQRFVAKTPFQAGIALATKSLLGSGGAKYRNPQYSGYADTVYLGCFWRSSLLEVSGYDEKATPNEDTELNVRLQMAFDTSQTTNQDAELNQRLLNRSKTAIYISAKIQAWYYPRKSWPTLWQQYFKYGRGRFLTAIKHTQRTQLRGKLPFIGISVLICMTLISLIIPSLKLPTLVLFGLAGLLPLIESLRVTLKHDRSFAKEIWRGNPQEIPSMLSRLCLCYITLITIPIAHFSGYGYQLIRRNVLNVESW
jgi:succinoglycan biosynthesis protein ExoA